MDTDRQENPPPFSSDLRSLVWPMSPEQFVADAMQGQVFFRQGHTSRLDLLRQPLGSFELSFLFAHGEEAKVWVQGGRETMRGTDSEKDVAALVPGAMVQTHLTRLPFARRFIADLARQMHLEGGFFSIFASRDSHTATHYDRNYNFTIQLCGQKTWTVHGAEPAVYAPSGCAALEEDRLARTSPHMHGETFRAPPGDPSVYVMAPGDMLYVPPGFWHATQCTGLSVQLNLSIEPLAWFEVIGRSITRHLETRQRWRAPFGRPSTHQVAEYLSELRQVTQRLSAADFVPDTHDVNSAHVHQPVRRTLGSLLMWENEGAGVFYAVDELRYLAKGIHGREHEVLNAGMEPLLRALANLDHTTTIGELSAALDLDCGRVQALVQKLVDVGYLTQVEPKGAP